MKRLLTFFAIAALAVAAPASADLIYSADISTTGNGLGAVYTVVTVMEHGTGPESGCINQNGSFTPCLGGLEGGDNQAINNVWTLDNNSGWGAVVNIAETGQDLTVTLTGLYLEFCGSEGCHVAYYTGPDLSLTQGSGTGIGGQGFVFILDPAQAAIVAGLGTSVKISGGVQFAAGSVNNGPETLNVARIGVPVTVPDGGMTLMLLGGALVGIGALRRKFRA